MHNITSRLRKQAHAIYKQFLAVEMKISVEKNEIFNIFA